MELTSQEGEEGSGAAIQPSLPRHNVGEPSPRLLTVPSPPV